MKKTSLLLICIHLIYVLIQGTPEHGVSKKSVRWKKYYKTSYFEGKEKDIKTPVDHKAG